MHGRVEERGHRIGPGDFCRTRTGILLLRRAARAHDARVQRACAFEHEGRHRLLANGLVAPTTAIGNDAAAALGWAISWLSPAQLLAPETRFYTPAFGLAAWLARIPLRPLNTPPQSWSERVVRWLLDDLALSARLWVRMAAFMSTRRYYLLHGEAVSPAALAIQRAKDNP